nr:hypothetical protein [Eubacterium sp.]
MKMNLKRILATGLSVMMVAAAFSVTPIAEAKAKLSVPTKVTVKAGKSKTMKITAKGYTVKKVKCVSEAKNVTLKTTKKSITVKAKKGTGGMSDFLVTTIKAKKGKKTQSYTFYTNVTITGKATITTKHIKTLAELKKIDAGNNRMKYVLDNDIDMTGWTEPIASMKCSIDGKNHTLENLSVPFVGNMWGATIENLAFDVSIPEGYSIYGDSMYAAPICYLGPGANNEISTVSNCKTTGSISCSGKGY